MTDLHLGLLASQRSEMYSLLALGFSLPTPELVEKIREGDFVRLLRENPFPFLGYSPEMHTLERFSLEAKERELSVLSLELQVEYTRLFVGPTSLVVPPYESVYREGYTVMGETTLSVFHAYEKAGKILSPDLKDLPDHVAVELEFLALLCEEEAALWQEEEGCITTVVEEERKFLEEHLLRWFSMFAEKVSGASSSPFYQSLARMTRDYLKYEFDYLSTLIKVMSDEQ